MATMERDLAGTCLACGDSVLPANRRNLNTSASKHVVPIWKEIVSKELVKRKYDVNLDDFLTGSSDPASWCMYRRCFCTYEKLLGAKATLESLTEKAIDIIAGTHATEASTKPGTSSHAPRPKRTCASSHALAITCSSS